MISFNNSDWLIPITQYYFYIIYIWAYNSGMQIEDLVPFISIPSFLKFHRIGYYVCSTALILFPWAEPPRLFWHIA